jgi:hypothetical protein
VKTDRWGEIKKKKEEKKAQQLTDGVKFDI